MPRSHHPDDPAYCTDTFPGECTVTSIIVLGASGDLAKKKTFPALFTLHVRGFLPRNWSIIGYARSKLSSQELRDSLQRFLIKNGNAAQVEDFLQRVSYISGPYDTLEGFQRLQQQLELYEEEHKSARVGRLFYLALPPSVYPQVVKGIKEGASALSGAGKGSWLRVIIEKPFGSDLATSEALSAELGRLFSEEHLYRIDHYLGKELMQNMLLVRFANQFLAPAWNRNSISNVQICFKEPFGTEGRGGYFDQFGIIRDVMQNHLMQVLALLTMEQPVSLSADDIRDEKVRVLRTIPPVLPGECVLGQYTSDGKQPGYLDDPTVPKGSKTPTFASCVLRINNARWAGVPFVMKAGKALNERKVEIRVQFKPPPAPIHDFDLNHMRNELVMRLQPDEAIYLKMVVKQPGLLMEPTMSELDLSYKDRYEGKYFPEAYERLILDAMRGDQQHFVRRDELHAAWAVWTPLLHDIDAGKLQPLPYTAGTRGPDAADELATRMGFVKSASYHWGRANL